MMAISFSIESWLDLQVISEDSYRIWDEFNLGTDGIIQMAVTWPLTYNGENVVPTIATSCLIEYSLN